MKIGLSNQNVIHYIKKQWKLIVPVAGFWLFISNFGLVTPEIGGWNAYSRISQIFMDIGVYNYRSELISNILFIVSCIAVLIVQRYSRLSSLNKKIYKHLRGLAIMFSFLLVLGNIAEKSSYIFGGPFRLLLCIASILKFFGLQYIILHLISICYSKVILFQKSGKAFPNIINNEQSKYRKYWIVIFLAWMPYLVFNFPGVVTTDGFWQLQQVTGLTPITDHHPVLHTSILKLISLLSFLFNGGNTTTIALYVLFQSILLSGIYAFTVEWLREQGLSKVIVHSVLCYYALFPIHGFNATVLSKDFLSGGFLLLTIIWFYEFLMEGDSVSRSLKWRIVGVISVISAGFMRNNAFYAVLISTILLLVFTLYKIGGSKLKNTLTLIVILGLLLSKGPILDVLQIPGSPATESLSIPVQQIARSIYLNEEIPEDIQKDVEKFFTVDEVKELYDPYISDPIKFRIAERGGDFNTIIRMWRILGIQNPFIYFDSFIFSNFGYWYPQINFSSVLFSSDEAIYTNNDIFLPFNGKGMYVSTFIVQAFQFIPILNLFFGIGFFFGLLIIAVDLVLLQDEPKRIFIVYAPLVLTFGTLLIAAPMTGSHRYAHFLFSTMPVYTLIPILLCKGKRNGS